MLLQRDLLTAESELNQSNYLEIVLKEHIALMREHSCLITVFRKPAASVMSRSPETVTVCEGRCRGVEAIRSIGR